MISEQRPTTIDPIRSRPNEGNQMLRDNNNAEMINEQRAPRCASHRRGVSMVRPRLPLCPTRLIVLGGFSRRQWSHLRCCCTLCCRGPSETADSPPSGSNHVLPEI